MDTTKIIVSPSLADELRQIKLNQITENVDAHTNTATAPTHVNLTNRMSLSAVLRKIRNAQTYEDFLAATKLLPEGVNFRIPTRFIPQWAARRHEECPCESDWDACKKDQVSAIMQEFKNATDDLIKFFNDSQSQDSNSETDGMSQS